MQSVVTSCRTTIPDMEVNNVHAEEYRKAFEDATTRIADLAAGDGHRRVPHIAAWTLADAVTHVGLVFSFVAKSVSQGGPIGNTGVAAWANDPDNRPHTAQLSEWFQTAANEVVDVIWQHDSNDEVWTSSQSTNQAKYWMRRMTQEATVHRWDIEAVTASNTAINAGIAVDGINEFYDFFVSERMPTAFAGVGTIHLHATDADGEWMITRHKDGIDVESAHGKGDVAARGPAGDLLLLVWNRVHHSTLETFGNTDLLDDHQRLLRV